jgi:hypothetical protein
LTIHLGKPTQPIILVHDENARLPCLAPVIPLTHLKINPTAKKLKELYSPTVYELAFTLEGARHPIQRVGLLLLGKTFQRIADC